MLQHNAQVLINNNRLLPDNQLTNAYMSTEKYVDYRLFSIHKHANGMLMMTRIIRMMLMLNLLFLMTVINTRLIATRTRVSFD